MLKKNYNRLCLSIYKRGRFLLQKRIYDNYRTKYDIAGTFRFNEKDILMYE
jgi:hypothetical protein